MPSKLNVPILPAHNPFSRKDPKSPVRFSRALALAALVEFVIILGLLWMIIGNDRLFRNAVPLSQRLVSRNESIRKKAQQELLSLGQDAKRDTARQLAAALEQEDAFVQKWAGISLALIGPSAQPAVPALLQRVSDKQNDVAQAARVALSEIGAPEPQHLPSLLRALEDPSEGVRCEAAASIVKMGPLAKEAVPLMVAQVKRPVAAPACMVSAVAGLTNVVPEATADVLALCDDASPEVRRNAARVLTERGALTPEVIGRLLKLLTNDEDSDVRRQTSKALTLRQAPERGEASVLRYAAVRSKNAQVREIALSTLRDLQLPMVETTPVLQESLRDSQAGVRLMAAEWVRDLDLQARPFVSALLTLLRDPEPQIRQAALEGLRRSGTHLRDALPVVARAQRDKDATVRCLAARQLVEMGAADRVSVAVFINDLRSGASDVHCAEDALGMAGLFNPDVVPALTKLLDEKDRETRSRAAFVLMQLGYKAKDAIPALQRAQKDQVSGADNALKAIRNAVRARR